MVTVSYRRRTKLFSGLFLTALFAPPLVAQTQVPHVDSAIIARLVALSQPSYRAMFRRYEIPPRHSRERMAIVISSSWCIGGKDPRFVPAVRAALRILSQQAEADSVTFSAMGVSLDWPPDSGAIYIQHLADFDQWVVGYNWSNDSAVRWIWNDSTVRAAIPQFIVVERERGVRARTDGKTGTIPTYGPERVIQRFLSANALADWVLAVADSAGSRRGSRQAP